MRGLLYSIYKLKLKHSCQKMLFNVGLSEVESKVRSIEIFNKAKDRMKKANQKNLPENYGKIVLEKERSDPSFMNFNIKRKDGVTDNDIKNYWDVPAIERFLIQEIDDFLRENTYEKYITKGINSREAQDAIRKVFPIYKEPEKDINAEDLDRPLPNEIKRRVDMWVQKNHNYPEIVQIEIVKHPTMNALIRAKIISGEI